MEFSEIQKLVQEGYEFSEVMRSTDDLKDIARSRDDGMMGNAKQLARYKEIRDLALEFRRADEKLPVIDALRRAKKNWEDQKGKNNAGNN